jgi:hypothetical protein
MKFTKSFVILLILSMLLIPLPASAAPGANQLTNPGCESAADPPTGWNDVTGDIRCADVAAYINPHTGTYAFAEWFAEDGAIEQVWDGGQDLTGYNFYYSFAYYDNEATDTGTVIYEFLDASESVIGTLYNSGVIDNTAGWNVVSGGPITAPANTQKVKVTMMCNHGGVSGYCDVWFDDFSLTGETPTAITLSGLNAHSKNDLLPITPLLLIVGITVAITVVLIFSHFQRKRTMKELSRS